jgi:ankyrin repeat protein
MDANVSALLSLRDPEEGRGAIHLAAIEGATAALHYLLDLTRCGHLEARDAAGATPLMCAVRAVSENPAAEAAARVLIARGAACPSPPVVAPATPPGEPF